MTVSGVQAAGAAWAVFARRCLAVIPHLPRLIFGPCRRMALPLTCSRVAEFLLDAMAASAQLFARIFRRNGSARNPIRALPWRAKVYLPSKANRELQAWTSGVESDAQNS
jgi:hypothetical protein